MPNKSKKSGAKKVKPKARTAKARVTALRVSVPKRMRQRPSVSSAYMAPGIRGMGPMSAGVTGSGAYRIRQNSLLSSGPVPNFGANEIRVSHREFLGNVMGSTGFLLRQFPLNPGQSITFPWLSQLAANYEQYKMHGMIFSFVSTSATAVSSTNTALGQVIWATDYDVLATPFSTEVEMLSTLFSNYGTPCYNLVHAIECDAKSRPINTLYVRTGPVPDAADARMYDMGVTSFATFGMQAASNVGGVWVSYDVTLIKPKIAQIPPPLYLQEWQSSDGETSFGTSLSAYESKNANLLIQEVVDNYAVNYIITTKQVGQTYLLVFDSQAATPTAGYVYTQASFVAGEGATLVYGISEAAAPASNFNYTVSFAIIQINSTATAWDFGLRTSLFEAVTPTNFKSHVLCTMLSPATADYIVQNWTRPVSLSRKIPKASKPKDDSDIYEGKVEEKQLDKQPLLVAGRSQAKAAFESLRERSRSRSATRPELPISVSDVPK